MYIRESDLHHAELRLQSRLCGRIRDLRFVLRDGGLILLGRAPTYYAKQLAQHAVMEEIKVPILVNSIEVSPASVKHGRSCSEQETDNHYLVPI
jgi:hypothetical protein